MNQLPRPTFTFLGHSAVRAEMPDGKVMLIDPWIEQNPACPEECKSFERVDAILITHAHADHMADAVDLAKRYQPEIVVSTYEICQWLAGKGVENCSGMNIGGSQEVLGCRVTQVQAVHTGGMQDGDNYFYGGVSGFVIRLPGGYTFYHAGDTALFSDMRLIAALHRPQLAFLPIGDHFTMDPVQAAHACKFLEVQRVIPIHWGTFPLLTGTPAALQRELEQIDMRCKVISLEPGESY